MSPQTRALIVDDDPICLGLLEAILVRLGLQVVAVEDPCQALEILANEKMHFDLMLTDFKMPGLDGAQLVRMVSEDHPNLPIVLVSSCLEEALERIDRQLLEGYVSKPFGIAELSAALGLATNLQAGEKIDIETTYLP